MMKYSLPKELRRVESARSRPFVIELYFGHDQSDDQSEQAERAFGHDTFKQLLNVSAPLRW